MERNKLERINALARLAKERPLTPEESAALCQLTRWEAT